MRCRPGSGTSAGWHSRTGCIRAPSRRTVRRARWSFSREEVSHVAELGAAMVHKLYGSEAGEPVEMADEALAKMSGGRVGIFLRPARGFRDNLIDERER